MEMPSSGFTLLPGLVCGFKERGEKQCADDRDISRYEVTRRDISRYKVTRRDISCYKVTRRPLLFAVL